MTKQALNIAIGFAATLLPLTAQANSLIAAGQPAAIAKTNMRATPLGEWNRLSAREGANTELWTRDGVQLNKVRFITAVAAGQPLLKERDSKNAPLPRMREGLLLADVPELLEATYRAQYSYDQMAIDRQEMSTLRGQPAIRFTYGYVASEDAVARKGEAVATLVDGKLYLVTYEAPELYYFGKDLDAFHKLTDTIAF